MSKRLYIETVGCQMNMLDSELVVASLRKAGYELCRLPREADAILFNTCSVRQHAEDKIYSALGRLKHLKSRHPEAVIGVLGCMAQKDQELIFKRAPFVDLIVGPGQLHQIPDLIEAIRNGSGPRIEVSLDRREGTRHVVAQSFESFDPLREAQMRPTPFQAYVRIMIGCDKFCTYCIVPKVRGPEQSRHPGTILAEVRQLVDEGCREVTLLGQTVNSYKFTEGDRTVRLADLLARLSDISGLDRIKFVTNYPRDMTRSLVETVRDLPKVARYLHVPAQSGSNDVLTRMKRGYTVEEYREMLAMIRETLPEAAVTSDFIVGFCGETDEDFSRTIDLVQGGRFKNSFIFKYSPRPGTKGDDLFPDDVPEDVKRRRNNELLAIQNRISEELNEPFLGRTVQVLVEGPSKLGQKESDAEESVRGPIGGDDRTLVALGHSERVQPVQLVGRTPCDRIVVFDGNPRQVGRLLDVVIYDSNAHTLFGAVSTAHVGPEVYSLA